MFIARTQGIPLTAVAASEVEGTSRGDNWQNILVKGSSSIRTPADLAGKTIAVNALKGVGEVMIKAALKKRGVDPNSVRLLALPFPAMRSALQQRPGRRDLDAGAVPDAGRSSDGGRIVMAPGPVLGRFWPIGGYVGAATTGRRGTPGSRRSSARRSTSRSRYAQANPDEIRELLPAATPERPAADLEPARRPRRSSSSSRSTRRSSASSRRCRT